MNTKDNRVQQEIATEPTGLQQTVRTHKAETKKKAIRYSKKITYIAVLVALSLIFKILGNFMNILGFRITLVYIPWTIAGVVLGPIGGAAVAFTTDILGTFTSGSFPLPLLTVGSALYPVFPALVYRYFPSKNGYLKVVLGSIVSLVVCTFFINSYALMAIPPYSQMGGYWGLMLYRLPQIGVFAVNMVLIGILFPLIDKVKEKF